MKFRIGAKICSSRKEMWDVLSNPNDTAWFLPPTTKLFVWMKSTKVPQECIDLMNGKKAFVFMKDWRKITSATI